MRSIRIWPRTSEPASASRHLLRYLSEPELREQLTAVTNRPKPSMASLNG
jgi:hypothetical protein